MVGGQDPSTATTMHPSSNIRQIFLMPPPLSMASKIQNKMSVGQFGHAHTPLTRPIHTHLASQMWPNSDGLIVFLGSTLDPTTTHSFPLLFSPSRYCALLLATVLCFLLLCSASCYCALLLATVLSLLLCSASRYCALLLTTVRSSLLFSPSHYCSLLATVLSFSLLCSPSRYCALLLNTVLCSPLFSPSHYCSLLATVLSVSLLCSSLHRYRNAPSKYSQVRAPAAPSPPV